MSRKASNQKGFTIIELLISTTIFTVVLAGVSMALIQIGRMYQKSIISSRTQSLTRTVIDDISRPLQFSSSEGATSVKRGIPVNGVESLCVGSVRYSFRKNIQVRRSPEDVNQGYHALWRDEKIDEQCTPVDINVPNPSGSGNGKELLGEYMRLKSFNVDSMGASSSKRYAVTVGIIYGDEDLIEYGDIGGGVIGPLRCKGIIGSEWCVMSELTTEVMPRL